jgi:hypothetical protein
MYSVSINGSDTMYCATSVLTTSLLYVSLSASGVAFARLVSSSISWECSSLLCVRRCVIFYTRGYTCVHVKISWLQLLLIPLCRHHGSARFIMMSGKPSGEGNVTAQACFATGSSNISNTFSGSVSRSHRFCGMYLFAPTSFHTGAWLSHFPLFPTPYLSPSR